MRGLTEADLPSGVTWPAVVERVRARVGAEVEARGSWRMTNQVGLFTCR
jgi:hypothetical protein